ncbi:MAG: flagellar M-ring protein FliF [Deltaproteobacteria bacterium]|nr:flagellar M-ring protein FliF [Deltaproteobacteria bacterium]
MRALIEQFIAVFKAMPTPKKVTMAIVLAFVVTGFAMMFFWANQVDYQLLYGNLSQEDAGKIVSKLREQRISYKLGGGGATVLVPADKVYELRLTLANDGLPVGGHVGFEIFDQTNFSTTEFVQRLNYQRALQGELVRTINDFREVEHCRVLLVMPEDSLFVEDSKPPSASVLLKLGSPLAPDKVAGIVHLVASAVEGLVPEQVTIVDSSGKVLFKGPNQADQSALLTSNRLDYQRQIEARIGGRIQSILEGIVGKGKAIVRVSADIDLDQIDFSEEKYDPDSSVIRSRQRKSELSEKDRAKGSAARLETTNQGTIPVQGTDARTRSQKDDEVVNYEINRVTRHVTKPSGGVERLSAAAAVDGNYEVATAEDGSETKKYVPRSKEELQELEKIVKRAMGFDEDRGDQVYVSSFPLSLSSDISGIFERPGIDWLGLARQYSKTALNLVLVILVFLFVVRPLLRSVKEIGTIGESAKRLPALEGESGTTALPEGQSESAALPEPKDKSIRERIMRLARDNAERTEQLLRGWLHEEK